MNSSGFPFLFPPASPPALDANHARHPTRSTPVAARLTTTNGFGGTAPLLTLRNTRPKGMPSAHPFAAAAAAGRTFAPRASSPKAPAAGDARNQPAANGAAVANVREEQPFAVVPAADRREQHQRGDVPGDERHRAAARVLLVDARDALEGVARALLDRNHLDGTRRGTARRVRPGAEGGGFRGSRVGGAALEAPAAAGRGGISRLHGRGRAGGLGVAGSAGDEPYPRALGEGWARQRAGRAGASDARVRAGDAPRGAGADALAEPESGRGGSRERHGMRDVRRGSDEEEDTCAVYVN